MGDRRAGAVYLRLMVPAVGALGKKQSRAGVRPGSAFAVAVPAALAPGGER